MFISNAYNNSTNDRIANLFARRWVGRRPCDPPRLLDVANAPYGIHRKQINHELCRPAPLRFETRTSSKTREQYLINQDSNKRSENSTGFNNPSNNSMRNIQSRNSRRSDDQFKDLVIKSEKIVPSTHFANGTTSTLTAWQKYWKSSHVERRRKGLHESEPVFYMPNTELPTKQNEDEQIIQPAKSITPTDINSNARTPVTRPSSCSPGNLSTDSESDKQQFLSESTDDINHVQSEEILQSNDASTMNIANSSSKLQINIPASKNNDAEKFITIEKSRLFSSRSGDLKSDSRLIEDVAAAQNSSNQGELKLYRLSSFVNNNKTKNIPNELKSRPKQLSRASKPPIPPKRHRSATVEYKVTIKSESFTTPKPINSTVKSKYNKGQWQEPYVGNRYDPPPPPSSPSYLIWPEENEYNQESIFGSFQIPESIANDAKLKAYEFL